MLKSGSKTYRAYLAYRWQISLLYTDRNRFQDSDSNRKNSDPTCVYETPEMFYMKCDWGVVRSVLNASFSRLSSKYLGKMEGETIAERLVNHLRSRSLHPSIMTGSLWLRGFLQDHHRSGDRHILSRSKVTAGVRHASRHKARKLEGVQELQNLPSPPR
jgi:hypothetical protein